MFSGAADNLLVLAACTHVRVSYDITLWCACCTAIFGGTHLMTAPSHLQYGEVHVNY